jgi:hypothetical protein
MEHETHVAYSEAWDVDGAGRGADEGDWFGAFHVPLHGPAFDGSEWLPNNTQEPSIMADENNEQRLQNCIACGTPTEDLWQLGCGHFWDRDCLSTAIELALQWEGNWPARCCEKIDDDEMRSLAPFLGDEIVRRYLEKYEELEISRHQRVYCANPVCSGFLGQRAMGIHLYVCLKCGTSTCLACGNTQEQHDHDQCSSEMRRVSHEELIRLGKLQQCPGCPEVVELKEACNHIT